MNAEDRHFAECVRAILAEKTGDSQWMRVPPERIPWPTDDHVSPEAMADLVLLDSYEPHHLADLDEG